MGAIQRKITSLGKHIQYNLEPFWQFVNKSSKIRKNFSLEPFETYPLLLKCRGKEEGFFLSLNLEVEFRIFLKRTYINREILVICWFVKPLMTLKMGFLISSQPITSIILTTLILLGWITMTTMAIINTVCKYVIQGIPWKLQQMKQLAFSQFSRY